MKHAKTPWWKNRNRLAFVAFLVIAGYFIWREHEAHITPYLIWILLIACLLLHGFMHGGHGHGGGADDQESKMKR
jgi:hypothetical protein